MRLNSLLLAIIAGCLTLFYFLMSNRLESHPYISATKVGFQNKIEISVIVPATYRDYKCFSARFLSHIFSGTYSFSMELLIVVSGVPRSVDIPTPQTTPIFLKVLPFYASHNQALNRNIGALFATGEILTFFDMDDIPHPDRFNIIGYLFRKYIWVEGAVFGFVRLSHEQISNYKFPPIKLSNLSEPFSVHALYAAYAAKVNSTSMDNLWCCSPVYKLLANGWGTYRRSIFFKYMYDENKLVGEDTELNVRMILDHHNFTFWDFPLGLYETKVDRLRYCSEQHSSLEQTGHVTKPPP